MSTHPSRRTVARRSVGTKERTAIHEAGHAIASHLLDIGFSEATIVRRGGEWGYVDCDVGYWDREVLTRHERLENIAVTLWAGLEAEYLVTGTRQLVHGGLGDMRNAMQLAAIDAGKPADAWVEHCSGDRANPFLGVAMRRSREILAPYATAIRGVAAELLRAQIIDRALVARIVAATAAAAA